MRKALAILASVAPGRELRPREWAELAMQEGLAKTLFSPGDRESHNSRERGIGVIFSKHRDEMFEARTPTTQVRVQFEGGFRRWIKGKNPFTRYVFRVLEEKALPVEE